MSRPDTAAYAIEVRALSKSYGGKLVIDDLSFVVEPGTVTGFLGPNGSGKSTTMRLIVGLDRPSAGTALIGGVEYAQLHRPLLTVGTLLDSEAVHPGRPHTTTCCIWLRLNVSRSHASSTYWSWSVYATSVANVPGRSRSA